MAGFPWEHLCLSSGSDLHFADEQGSAEDWASGILARHPNQRPAPVHFSELPQPDICPTSRNTGIFVLIGPRSLRESILSGDPPRACFCIVQPCDLPTRTLGHFPKDRVSSHLATGVVGSSSARSLLCDMAQNPPPLNSGSSPSPSLFITAVCMQEVGPDTVTPFTRAVRTLSKRLDSNPLGREGLHGG